MSQLLDPSSSPALPHARQITGSVVALITPFSADAAQIDFVALQRLIEWQIASGTDAIVLAGSTGEAANLDRAEFQQLLERGVAIAAGRVPLLAGTGHSSTRVSLELAEIARNAGVQAQLVVAPAYVRPTQAGMLAHYLKLADESRLPVMLYNVPARTGCDLLPETVAMLAGHEQIIGIKEALADASRIAHLLQLQSDHFSVLTGDDPTALASLKLGARGLISVAANAWPCAIAKLVHAAMQQSFTIADDYHEKLSAAFDTLGLQPNPIAIKWLCAQRGLCQNSLRLPLLPLTSRDQRAGNCESSIEAEFAGLLSHPLFAQERRA